MSTVPPTSLAAVTVPDLVTRAADFGAAPAAADECESYSYVELAAEVERWTRAAIADGVQPGHRVAIRAPNSVAWILAALGTMAADGIVVPVNTRFNGVEASYVLACGRAGSLFTVTDFLGVDHVDVIPGVEVRIVDDHGNDAPTGTPGEILVRGFNVMQGYLDDPVATAEAIDADGWLHSGDIGVMDDRGYLRVTGRKKDMFIVGGFNAYPAEIEDLLLAHSDLSQVAVVGVPDERMGEVGMAFVVPRAGAAITAEEVIAFARERMANFKVPRLVRVVEELPVNAAGNVLEYELRARALAA